MIQREKKVIQIADSVHGNLQISQLEKHIVNTHAFNRLHNILQNSTVYLTYPSNRTKRFEHSLGVMHLSGQMLRQSLINAEQNIRDEFLSKVKQEIEDLVYDNEFSRNLRTDMGNYGGIYQDFDSLVFDDPLYEMQTPYNIKKEYYNVFQLLNQSVRCAALLHDIGHPPFSHITEFALKDVFKEIKKIDSNKLNERQSTFLAITEKYYDEKKGTFALHEQIGIKIANRLFETIIENETTTENEDDAKWRLFYLYVQRLTMNILEDKNSLFSDIHKIIDGSIDSDRLDYVTRDVQNSGFTQGKIEYDRLISTMKLMKIDGKFQFCFNVRSMSTIEDFFYRRWFLWKYVIYHHRVIKTDELLGNAVKELSLNYLNESVESAQESPHEKAKNSNQKQENQVIPLDISGLWKAIDLVPHSNDQYFNSLIQWDDSWLLTVLRQEYYTKYQSKNKNVADQLEELLSNKRNYRSVVKRMNDFLEIDEEVIKHFNFEWDLKKAFERDMLLFIRPIINQYNLYHESYNEWKKQAPIEGFFIGKLFQLMEFLQLESDFFTIVRSSMKEAVQQFGADDCIVTFKSLKTGLEKNPYVHNGQQAMALDQISRIHHDLKQNRKVFPIFHAYVSKSEGINMRELRKKIGRILAEEIRVLLEKGLV